MVGGGGKRDLTRSVRQVYISVLLVALYITLYINSVTYTLFLETLHNLEPGNCYCQLHPQETFTNVYLETYLKQLGTFIIIKHKTKKKTSRNKKNTLCQKNEKINCSPYSMCHTCYISQQRKQMSLCHSQGKVQGSHRIPKGALDFLHNKSKFRTPASDIGLMCLSLLLASQPPQDMLQAGGPVHTNPIFGILILPLAI